MKCDIIIPIYNAYESLVECLNSVISSTNLKKHQLVLIDDKSTDKRIKKYLDDIKSNHKDLNIKILENVENLGFVKTVNRGMKDTKHDVLLLNSDTVVSKKWLDKIIDCAYSDEDVATVTPLSNNATLVSVPNCLERNEIDDIDIQKYNDILETIFDGKYYELPTGHGFCLFIKRKVLDEIGLFDDVTFEKGYGEENDFCYRCLDYGYKHLLCSNTIVYHKESQSFESKKNDVLDKHLMILRNRYPLYCKRTDNWLSNIPIRNLANKIYYAVNFSNNKPNVLIIIHDWDTKTGGTTLHVRDLISKLNDKYNFVILHKNDISDNYALSTVVGSSEKKLILNQIFHFSDYCLTNMEYKNMVSRIIDDFNISTIHIHHLKYHYWDVLNIAKKKNITVIITLHDFYCLCPTINMLECGKECCIDNENKNCSKCLKVLKNCNNNIILRWQQQWHQYLKKVDIIITPSLDAKKHILKYYDDLKIDVIEHGIEFKRSSYIPSLGSKINVAMIGVLCNHKGGYIFEELIKLNDNRISFHSFGYSEIVSLQKSKKNYIYHGIYKRNELHDLLEKNNIDLICFFQKWPETYSYTLNEAISAGIPVLSFDIGAGADRIKKNDFGWLIDKKNTVDEIRQKIINILNDKKDYQKKIDAIQNYQIKTVSQMCKEYDKIYVSEQNKYTYVFHNLDEITFDKGIELKKLNEILHSTKWKLINKIRFPKKVVYLVRKIIKKG